MKLVVHIRLLPAPVQAAALEATLRACNEAAAWASEVAFEKVVRGQGQVRARTVRAVDRTRPKFFVPGRG